LWVRHRNRFGLSDPGSLAVSNKRHANSPILADASNCGIDKPHS
jgi:hypothetical protein